MKSLLPLLLLWACGPATPPAGRPPDDSARIDGTIIDTANHAPDTARTAANNPPLPTGIYQAQLPCPDCPGIEHTVAFYPDRRFRLEERRWGPASTTIQTNGRWAANGDQIVLTAEGRAVGSYQWQNDTLYQSDDGRSLALYKVPPITENSHWVQKGAAGLELLGTGTEPFWSIEVDEGKAIRFHLADWKEPRSFTPAPPRRSADSTVYQATGAGRLRVTVHPYFCSDGMSDFIYPHRVSVEYEGKVYEGCGMVY